MSDDKRIRRMEGDLELMAAHLSRVQTQVEDLTTVVEDLSEAVRLLREATEGLAFRLGVVRAELKENGR